MFERARVRVVAAIGALVLAIAGSGVAQESVKFSTERNLPGFSDAELGADSDLYDLAPFKTLDGRVLALADVDAAKEQWKSEQARVAAELERLKADPVARTRRGLSRRIAAHSFLSRIELVECTDFAPLHFLIERPPKAQPGFEKAIARFYAPWLLAAVAAFEKEFAALLPPRREGRALLPITVLSSEGEFDNFWKLSWSEDYISGTGHWDRGAQVAVIYQDAFSETREAVRQRKLALYALMRAELSSYALTSNAPPALAWLREGLACLYLTNGGTPEQPVVGTLSETWGPSFGRFLRDETARESCFLPVAELRAIGDWPDLFKRLGARRGGEGDAEWAARAHDVFQIESGLFAWFLLHEEGGRRRALVERGLAETFGTTDKLAAAAGDADAAALQKAFVAFLARESAKGKKKDEETISPELVTRLETWAPTVVPNAGAAAAAGSKAPGRAGAGGAAPSSREPPPSSKVLDATFLPESLLEEPFPPDARLGLALMRAAVGELDAARAECAALREPRADRDAARLEELAATRRQLFERCVADHRKLKFERDGATVAGTAQELDGDALLVVDAKGKLTRVPLASVGPEELLKRMSELKLELGTPLARAYAALLAGRKNWAKGIAGATPDEAALKEDGEATAELLAKGDAARRIEALAKAPLPASVAAGESLQEKVAALLSTHGAVAFVVARKPLLRSFLGHALAAQFEARGLASLGLHGKVASLGEGRIRVSWDFESAKQAEDWVPTPFPDSVRWPQKLATSEADSFMKIEDGAVQTRGVRFWRTRLEFDAPMTVIVNEQYERGEGSAGSLFSFLGISLCDDGAANRLVTVNMAGMQVFDAGKFESDDPPTPYDVHRPYQVRVAHDGAKATISCESFKDRSVPVLGRRSGGVGLLSYSDMIVHVLDVTIEGRLAPKSLVPLRDAWLEQELARLESTPSAPSRR